MDARRLNASEREPGGKKGEGEREGGGDIIIIILLAMHENIRDMSIILNDIMYITERDRTHQPGSYGVGSYLVIDCAPTVSIRFYVRSKVSACGTITTFQ